MEPVSDMKTVLDIFKRTLSPQLPEEHKMSNMEHQLEMLKLDRASFSRDIRASALQGQLPGDKLVKLFKAEHFEPYPLNVQNVIPGEFIGN